jgi:hypothetical protein
MSCLMCVVLLVFGCMLLCCVECTAKKDDVGLQITPCLVQLYTLALRMYRPCVHMMK